MKKKLLIFIITYNASFRLTNVLKKINFKKLKKYNVEILISDDKSSDDTVDIAKNLSKKNKSIFYKVNKKNLHYGGNIKSCIKYAEKNDFNFAAMIHGDDQYNPKYLLEMLRIIEKKKSICVCGSKMNFKIKALKAKMPFYKFIGNIILTNFFNFLYNTNFSDCHTGLWLYDVNRIKKEINLKKLTNGYNFDNQIRIEIVKKKAEISEVPIIAKYGDENSSIHLFYSIKFLFETFYRRFF